MEILIVTQILNGITVGLIFALVAIGLTIVMGLMEVVNFAHGSFYLIGGYITFLIVSVTGNFYFGLLGALAASIILGVPIFFTIIRPLEGREPLEAMVALIGVSMIIRQAVRTIWGADPKLLPIPFGRIEIRFFGLSLTYPIYFLVVMSVAIVILLSLYFLLKKTDIGIRCLAAIQDRDTALSLGVNVNRISAFMFVVGVGVASLAGGLVGPIFSVYPTMGIELMGLIFVIVIIGGMGSIGGALIAGLMIALTKSISGIFVGGSFSEILAYCILLVILIVRPRGIMGLAAIME